LVTSIVWDQWGVTTAQNPTEEVFLRLDHSRAYVIRWCRTPSTSPTRTCGGAHGSTMDALAGDCQSGAPETYSLPRLVLRGEYYLVSHMGKDLPRFGAVASSSDEEQRVRVQDPLRREIQSTTEAFSAPIRHGHVPRAQANHPDHLPTLERWRKDESAATVSCLRVAAQRLAWRN
jgi:hypothetical protein